MRIFIIPVHVERLEKSIMPENFSAAYVSCYTAGDDYIEATKKVLSKLHADGLHPMEILQPIFEFSSNEWTKHIAEKWPNYTSSLLNQDEFEDAMKKNKVVYGPFGSYESANGN